MLAFEIILTGLIWGAIAWGVKSELDKKADKVPDKKGTSNTETWMKGKAHNFIESLNATDSEKKEMHRLFDKGINSQVDEKKGAPESEI